MPFCASSRRKSAWIAVIMDDTDLHTSRVLIKAYARYCYTVRLLHFGHCYTLRKCVRQVDGTYATTPPLEKLR
jgi:hypothetical protein